MHAGRDNCRVARTPYLDATVWKLSACAFSDGRSAYTDAGAGEAGPTFNDTAYLSQFPRPLSAWGYEETVGLDGEGVLERSRGAAAGGHGADNVTEYILTKERVQLVGGSEYVYVVRFCVLFPCFCRGRRGGGLGEEGWQGSAGGSSVLPAIFAVRPRPAARPPAPSSIAAMHPPSPKQNN